MDIAELKDRIRGCGVNMMWFTGGWLNQLVDADISIFSTLKVLVAGGDKLSPVTSGSCGITIRR